MRSGIRLLAMAVVVASAPLSAKEAKPDPAFVKPRAEIVANVHRIGVMPVNVPGNVPNRVEVARRLETEIESQLRAGGFEVVPAAAMRDIRDELKRTIGGLYDPVTGRPVDAKVKSYDEFAKSEYEAAHEVDGLLYPVVVSRKVEARGGQASWDGAVESASGPIKQNFLTSMDGNGALPGVSLLIVLEDKDGKVLYAKYGALQMTRHVYSNGFRIRHVAVDPAHLMKDPERDSRALMIALQPLASGVDSPVPGKLPRVNPAPVVADLNALRVPRSALLSAYPRLALLPLSMGEDQQRAEVVSRYRELLENRLKSAGFETVDAAEAGAALEQLRKSGPGFYDPITGDFDEARWNAARLAILKDHAQRLGAQAIVAPSLVVSSAFFIGGDATWDGAKESITSAKSALGKMFSPDAGYSGIVPALSLSLKISDLADRSLFEEVGGIRLRAKLIGGQFTDVPQAELFDNPNADLKAIEIAMREIIAAPETAKKR